MADSVYITVPLQLAGVFKFQTPPRSALPSYEAGASVNIIINIINNGTYGQFACQIFDDDTDSYLAGFGDYLNTGQSKAYTTLVGTMPPYNWNLRIDLTP